MEVKETKTKEVKILSIDPGNIETAFVLMDKDLKQKERLFFSISLNKIVSIKLFKDLFSF